MITFSTLIEQSVYNKKSEKSEQSVCIKQINGKALENPDMEKPKQLRQMGNRTKTIF